MGVAEKQERSFRELVALNYRVNQERSCKEVKGLSMLDYRYLGEFVCYLTRYNDKWKKTRVAEKQESG